MLLNLYDSLENKVEDNTISQNILQELSKMHLSSLEIGPKELVDLKNQYNNLLAVIQLGSNHTREELKENFIAILKARSVIGLIESLQDITAIIWKDVYFVISVIARCNVRENRVSSGTTNS